MRVFEEKDGASVRRALTGLITSDGVLSRTTPHWDGELFAPDWANTIADWCVDYHNKHGRAPGRDIEGLFAAWASEGRRDRSLVSAVESFLSDLSEEYEKTGPVNVDYLVDEAAKYFNKVRLSRLAEKVKADLDAGRVDRAQERAESHHKIELGAGAVLDLVRDEHSFDDVFDDKEEPALFTYPGAAGEFFNGILERESFLCFIAPEKTGKTAWLIDMSYRAVRAGCKVAYFQLGDLSARQAKERFAQRMCHRPVRRKNGYWPKKALRPKVLIPPSVAEEAEGKCAVVKHEVWEFDHPLTKGEFEKAQRKIRKDVLKDRSVHLRLSSHLTASLSVMQMKAILDSWALDGWSPDVLVCDYADIFAPPKGRMEPREQVNTSWKQLSAIRLEYHCCLITATQANAASYAKRLMDRRNFSEDHRKMGHCTAMCGINVTGEEKEKGLCRLNWFICRDKEYSSRKALYVAGDMALTEPCMVSSW